MKFTVSKEALTRIESLLGNSALCEMAGGHGEDRVVVEYTGSSRNVLAYCKKCEGLYSRAPTAEEREIYNSVFDRIVTI